MFFWKSLALAGLVTAGPGVGASQVVRGTIVDVTDKPMSGVVVLLVDSMSHVSGRALTSESGEFRLVAPRPGTFRLRTLRIGFAPVLSEPMVVLLGINAAQRIVVRSIAISLDTIRVADKGDCQAFTDSGGATFAVWEQIRTALMAAELTANSRTITATTVKYDRAFNPAARVPRAIWENASASTQYATRAWRTLSPDSLRRIGYVTTGQDNSLVFYAPGIDMLLSSVFTEDHCFRLVRNATESNRVGIEFEPIPKRHRGVVEIRGTLSIDRSSSELRELRFRYVDLPAVEGDVAEGAMSFARMRDGTWVISRWELRMPVVERVILPRQPVKARVTEVRVSGGLVALARRGNDTLWTASRMALGGVVVDSLSGSPLPRARVALGGFEFDTDADGTFAVAGILPGEYRVEVRTNSLDSVNAVQRSMLTLVDSTDQIILRVPNGDQFVSSLCQRLVGTASTGKLAGIVLGALKLNDPLDASGPIHGGTVVAEWTEGADDSSRTMRLEARATDDGHFILCGLPINRPISLRATADSAATGEPSLLRLTPAGRLARVGLMLERKSN